ncbi:hypothetical protein WAI453_001689 [Rhynchosporium graminicola]
MGDDLHTLSPTALSILNHPAAIAVNQDPKGRSVYLVHHEKDAAPDIFGLSSIQVWTGTLYGGDQIVFLLNAGGKDTKISASLEEIFTHDRPEGSAPQVKEEWEVYDLWAKRMDNVSRRRSSMRRQPSQRSCSRTPKYTMELSIHTRRI